MTPSRHETRDCQDAAAVPAQALAGRARRSPRRRRRPHSRAPSSRRPTRRLAMPRRRRRTLSRSVKVGLNKSLVVDLPRDARDILVSNPAIADAVIRTPRRIYLTGVAVGQANIIVFDRPASQIVTLDLQVERDNSTAPNDASAAHPRLQHHRRDRQRQHRALGHASRTPATPARRRTSPTSSPMAAPTPSRPDRAAARQHRRRDGSAVSVAVATGPGTTPTSSVVNLLTIEGEDQVQLKVTIAEVQRNSSSSSASTGMPEHQRRQRSLQRWPSPYATASRSTARSAAASPAPTSTTTSRRRSAATRASASTPSISRRHPPGARADRPLPHARRADADRDLRRDRRPSSPAANSRCPTGTRHRGQHHHHLQALRRRPRASRRSCCRKGASACTSRPRSPSSRRKAPSSSQRRLGAEPEGSPRRDHHGAALGRLDGHGRSPPGRRPPVDRRAARARQAAGPRHALPQPRLSSATRPSSSSSSRPIWSSRWRATALARPDDGFAPPSDAASIFLGRLNRVYGVKGQAGARRQLSGPLWVHLRMSRRPRTEHRHDHDHRLTAGAPAAAVAARWRSLSRRAASLRSPAATRVKRPEIVGVGARRLSRRPIPIAIEERLATMDIPVGARYRPA